MLFWNNVFWKLNLEDRNPNDLDIGKKKRGAEFCKCIIVVCE